MSAKSPLEIFLLSGYLEYTPCCIEYRGEPVAGAFQYVFEDRFNFYLLHLDAENNTHPEVLSKEDYTVEFEWRS